MAGKKDNTFPRWGWDCQVLGNGSRLYSPEAQECSMVSHWAYWGDGGATAGESS